MQNRDHHAIIRDFLSVAMENSEGLKISQLQQSVDLTSHQARSYIAELEDKGMIARDHVTKRYRMTPKGARYLQAINHLQELLDRPSP